MLVKSEIKRIVSLQQKKYRNEHGLFFVEGKKTVQELLVSTIALHKIYCTNPEDFTVSAPFLEHITDAECKRISNLKTPNGVVGVFKKPAPQNIDFTDWIVVLDDVQDPGNLGTIIRLCDWFGMQHLVCSKNTVDCFNPKVLQATMGSIARVNIHYVDLVDFLKNTTVPIYGAFMDGKSVYETQLPTKGILVMGNEGNGISSNVEKFITQEISIPQFGEKTAESLNVATATAILLNEIRRG